LDRFVTLQNQIESRESLIQTVDQEITEADASIQRNGAVVQSLSVDIERMQAEYSRMVRNAFLHKTLSNPLLYILSAENLNQAFRRWLFLRKYDRFRIQQSEAIVFTRSMLSKRIKELEQTRDLNLLATMTVAGLWHGAGWNFLLWGFGHGLWLVLERHAPSLPERWSPRLRKVLKTAVVFHGVCLLWVLFRAPSTSDALAYLGRLLLPPYATSTVPGALSGWLLAFLLLQKPLDWTFGERRFAGLRLPAQWGLSLAAGYLILAYAGARIDFIYFTF
jgi:hypothetical protein